MAIIITLLNQKGGSGKTTISLLLYEAFRKKGVKKISIVDTDPQQSIVTISQRLPNLNISVGGIDDFEKLNSDNDMLIVDTPPSLDTTQNPAITKILPLTDIIVLPVRMSPTDLYSLQPTINLVKAIQKNNPSVKASILINAIRENYTFDQMMKKVVQGYGLPIFTTRISQKVAYNRFVLKGGIYKEKNKQAIEQIEHLVNEVYTTITL